MSEDVYPEGRCHPDCYESNDYWVDAVSNEEAQRNVENWRVQNPERLFDFHNFAGRVVYRKILKSEAVVVKETS